MRKKGKCIKNNKKGKVVQEPEELVRAPHTFVLHRGNANPALVNLTRDFRRMMEPFTASTLRERKSNKIKDFVSLSGVFHISHMLIFNEASTQLSFKILRLPRGPTLTFKVHQFTLARDVLAAQKKQLDDPKSYLHAPLVILNSFSGDGKHIKLMASTFQNMFPTINLKSVKLSTIRRCVMLSYNSTTKLIDLRHYLINVAPVGVAKNIKKVVSGKVPNLGGCEDITDFVAQGAASDSEFEDEDNQVVLPQKFKKGGNIVDNKSSIVLYELGPRITFQLMKIEEELMSGEVLYHDFIVKTAEEIQALRKEKERKNKLKEHRKKEQNENIERKQKEKDGRKKKGKDEDDEEDGDAAANEPEDDADYYREEVGEEPEEELFSKQQQSNSRPFVPKYTKMSRKRKAGDDNPKKEGGGKPSKKFKFEAKPSKGGGGRKKPKSKSAGGHKKKNKNKNK